MRASNTGERKLTELDFTRLRKFTAAGAMRPLADLLDEADVLPAQAIPADVITMYARFVVRDVRTQRRHLLALCYPLDADPGKGRISVLSPAGIGLIGVAVGALAGWISPNGESTVVRIEEVLFQPEASGDYVT
jgi:regulator of nucleoside diphosphate kinase